MSRVIKNVIEREMKVSRQIDKYKDNAYVYGAIKVHLPKELIGKRVKVLVIWD